MKPFATWADVVRAAKAGTKLCYHAPMDYAPRRVTIARIYKNGKLRIARPSRDADPFTADAGHLNRFRTC